MQKKSLLKHDTDPVAFYKRIIKRALQEHTNKCYPVKQSSCQGGGLSLWRFEWLMFLFPKRENPFIRL